MILLKYLTNSLQKQIDFKQRILVNFKRVSTPVRTNKTQCLYFNALFLIVSLIIYTTMALYIPTALDWVGNLCMYEADTLRSPINVRRISNKLNQV